MVIRRFVAAFAVVLVSAPAFAQDTTVRIKNFMFMPMAVTIHAGETVKWENLDEEPHTVTSETGLFRSGGIDGGGTFPRPGVYKYTCSIHPQMIGTITVK